MSKLEDIGIRVEMENTSPGQVGAILCELQDKLTALNSEGRRDSIDLRTLPLFPDDYELLRETLGYGEIHISINAMGPTEIYETAIPGIWWIIHYNSEEEIVAEYIEITSLPDLIKTDPREFTAAEQQLQRLIDSLDNKSEGRHETG